MDDFTKIKLINSLIDAVSHFYDLKQKGEEKQYHLKGFCEGMAYTLVEMKAIGADEAKRILQGLGKKIEKKKEETISESKLKEEEQKDKQKSKKEESADQNDLDIPTVFRKKSTPDSNLA
jgi:hypothetical protein